MFRNCIILVLLLAVWLAVLHTVSAQENVSGRSSPGVLDQRPRTPGTFITAPENRGEDFTNLPTKDLLRHLAAGQELRELRKSAKAIGDRAIRGTLDLDDTGMQIVEKYVASQIVRIETATTGNERREATGQLQRLWRLSVPQLLNHVGSSNPFVGNTARELLCLMRDENVISSLIARVEASKDARYRRSGVFILGMMCEKRDPWVPDRRVLDDTTSKELAERLIIPFLDRIEAADPDPIMKKTVANARRFLKDPVDGRPRAEKPSEKEASKKPAVAVPENVIPTTALQEEKAEERTAPPDASSKTAYKAADTSEASASPHEYLWAGLGTAIVLLGAAWFGYRRFRQVK